MRQLKDIETGLTPRTVPKYFLDERNILCREHREQGKVFQVICLPKRLIPLVLDQSHNLLGHNGSPRMYLYISRMFYWPSMHKEILDYCKRCVPCRQMNLRHQAYPPLHLYIPNMPLQLVALDLITLPVTTSAGNKYALTMMDMLTSYVWAAPIPNKEAATVIRAFLTHFYEKEGGCMWILTDNGSEFTNMDLKALTRALNITHINSSPHHPMGNAKLEMVHKFIKDCLTKYTHQSTLEWDELLSKAVFAYNVVPGAHSRESPFFLMRGRDPIVPLTKLLGPRPRYLGNNYGLLSIDQLTRCWALAAFNIKMSRLNNPDLFKDIPMGELRVGDPVFVQHHDRPNKLEPRFLPHYRLTKILSDRQVEVMAPDGTRFKRNIQDVHYQYPASSIARAIPEAEAFGRSAKVVYHPKSIPDLKWPLTKQLHPYLQPTKSQDQK